MNSRILGWLVGLDQVESIDSIQPDLAASWTDGPGWFWLVLGGAAAFAAAIAFYTLLQPRGSLGARLALAAVRGLVLTLILVTLADPVLQITVTQVRPPVLYLVVDGSESMAIADELAAAERKKLEEAAGLEAAPEGAAPRTRLEYVKAWLERPEENLVARLQEEKGCRVEVFTFDGASTSQLRRVGSGDQDRPLDLEAVEPQLTPTGQVTALGAVVRQMGEQIGAGGLAGVVLVSDFAHNSGAAPVGARGGGEGSLAERLGAPIYTVGVGALEARDLSADLSLDPRLKKAERSSLQVQIRQTGLDGRPATVRLRARPLSGPAEGSGEFTIGEQTVTLAGPLQSVEFPFTPEDAGRFEFTAEVDPLDGEAAGENNSATREANIIDDYLRLLYAADEPDWEWRFIKEVFHRDKLVGMDGFRTFLRSSDARVRESNVLFLPTLTPSRSEFFAYDVIFLGDLPRSALTPRFCEMVKEFVGKFGGGLVVIGGPRYGPRELLDTELADMLPVRVDEDSRLADDAEFRVKFSPFAFRYPFMRLGADDAETARAWDNLGPLPWRQRVAAVHEQAVVLAEHPTDVCLDGRTPQPLIAIRPYGAGEVCYLGFNETWRLRRKYGEKYYRQFWSQLIYRLGMAHALGADKRFVVRTDRPEYRADEEAVLTIEAYDENFEPLTEDRLPGKTLPVELQAELEDGPTAVRPLAATQLRPGVFEARVPLAAAGAYAVRVRDPLGDGFRETRFRVSGVSAERRTAVRNVQLQEQLAAETRGRSYDLTTAASLVEEISAEPLRETLTSSRPLWSTPLWFGLLAGLLLCEWLFRKWINLA